MVSEKELKRTELPWRIEICNGCDKITLHGSSEVDHYDSNGNSKKDEILTVHYISGTAGGAIRTEADAEFIVKAVNSYQILLTAVRTACTPLREIVAQFKDDADTKILEQLIQAIQLAEGV